MFGGVPKQLGELGALALALASRLDVDVLAVDSPPIQVAECLELQELVVCLLVHRRDAQVDADALHFYLSTHN